MSIVEVFSLLGGVGLFLFGMTIMSSGLKNACGDNLQVILEHATKNKIVAVLVGLGMTMLVQSSSATDVMVIGFVNSGLMKLTGDRRYHGCQYRYHDHSTDHSIQSECFHATAALWRCCHVSIYQTEFNQACRICHHGIWYAVPGNYHDENCHPATVPE